MPKQSQVGLLPDAHLAYEAACFERAQAGGRSPRLHGTLPPSPALPHGALLVDEIVGRPARLPADLPALVEALAALHRLPLHRRPLPSRSTGPCAATSCGASARSGWASASVV